MALGQQNRCYCTACGELHDAPSCVQPSVLASGETHLPSWTKLFENRSDYPSVLCESCYEELLMSDKPHHPDFIDDDVYYPLG